jgi:CRP-like cAMP-binding protein
MNVGYVGIFILLPSLLDKNVFEQKKINNLGAGESFGELALLYEDSKRSATVIALSDCELAYMDKGEYKRVVGSY